MSSLISTRYDPKALIKGKSGATINSSINNRNQVLNLQAELSNIDSINIQNTITKNITVQENTITKNIICETIEVNKDETIKGNLKVNELVESKTSNVLEKLTTNILNSTSINNSSTISTDSLSTNF